MQEQIALIGYTVSITFRVVGSTLATSPTVRLYPGANEITPDSVYAQMIDGSQVWTALLYVGSAGVRPVQDGPVTFSIENLGDAAGSTVPPLTQADLSGSSSVSVRTWIMNAHSLIECSFGF